MGEGVGPFILHLRESHSRWRSREPATGSDDEMRGRQKYDGPTPPHLCQRCCLQQTLKWDEVREALRVELAKEIQVQVTDLKTALLTELRSQTQVTKMEQLSSGEFARRGPLPQRGRDCVLRWDESGWPICLQCEQMVKESPPVGALTRPAIVGECPEVEIRVQVKLIPCILDTGSQVTLISQGEPVVLTPQMETMVRAYISQAARQSEESVLVEDYSSGHQE
ncbi:hypothetical protein SKAU_G00058180 [Synaphobranchus kaupii]|uniref:Uncharacterized protein n=1 Tax=Synaphobranchus kaupii TaxID=118154 RepID=A0A9Q1G588_SYNKA|nr:hypothetical protein SKAU_G00058180 [Synaphobranchus kaupii]